MTVIHRYLPDRRLRADDRTVLMAGHAEWDGPRYQADRQAHAAHICWDLEDWSRATDRVTWRFAAPDDDAYAVDLLVHQRTAAPVRIELTCGDQRATTTLAARTGPDWAWARAPVGSLRPGRGEREITARAWRDDGQPFDLRVRALELAKPAVRDHQRAAALALRADARWLPSLGHGLMVHWTPDSFPRRGDRLPYAQAVDAFPVEAFADQVAETGAGFLVFVTAHGHQVLPAPIAALDRVLPGRTTRRDLIAELADALGRRGVKLMLYYHLGAASDPAWLDASGFWATDPTPFFDRWCAIVGELGERYGERVIGWWFDDGTANYSYRNAPWERLYRAAKRGHPGRLVGFNAWEWPSATEFMDYCTGETPPEPSAFGWLARGGDGVLRGGPSAGLQACQTILADGDWVHGARDADIGAPNWTADQLGDLLRAYAAHRHVPIFNCAVYQDGALSARTVETFRAAHARARAARA